MRILKNKIAQAQAFLIRKQAEEEAKRKIHNLTSPKQTSSDYSSESDIPARKLSSSPPKHRRRFPGFSFTPESTRQTKNIVKNFGRAISTFATSPLAVPYLIPLLELEGVEITLDGFITYVNTRKKDIDGLNHFRNMLVSQDGDTKEVAAYKRIFIQVSEVFIKYFSVNWIFHGKVQHKAAHLKFRFKMLRRIKSPELFTYLKKSKREKRFQKKF